MEKSVSARVREVASEVENLTEAMASGALKGSPALDARLTAAEALLGQLRSQETQRPDPPAEALIPDIANSYRRLVRDLARSLHRTDADRARIELGRLVGPVKVEPADTEIRLYNAQGRLEAALLRAVGSGSTASFVVAGAGFEPATFGL